MIHPTGRRPPGVVVVAAVLYTLQFVVTPVIVDIWSLTHGTTPAGFVRSPFTWWAINVVVTAAFAAVGYGLVRGSRLARGTLFVFVAARVVLAFPGFTSWWLLFWLGMAVLALGTAVLVTVPTARSWFAEATPPVEQPAPPGLAR